MLLRVSGYIKSPDHGLDNGPGGVAVISESLVIDHLAAVVEEADALTVRDGFLLAEVALEVADCGRGLGGDEQVLSGVLHRADLDLEGLVAVGEVEVLLGDGLLRVGEGVVEAEDGHLVLVELGVDAHLDVAVEHGDAQFLQDRLAGLLCVGADLRFGSSTATRMAPQHSALPFTRVSSSCSPYPRTPSAWRLAPAAWSGSHSRGSE